MHEVLDEDETRVVMVQQILVGVVVVPDDQVELDLLVLVDLVLLLSVI